VAAKERAAILPEVPTSGEAGLREFVSASWLGLYAPPKAPPPPILRKWRAAAVAALDDPLVQRRFPVIGGSVPRGEDRGGERMLEIVKARLPVGPKWWERQAASRPSPSLQHRDRVGAARAGAQPCAGSRR